MTPMSKMWVDEIRKNISGMDCFSIDAIVDKKGNHFILEVNGSSQGFASEHEDEYLDHLKKLVISRLDEAMHKKHESKRDSIVGSDLSLENLNLKNEVEYLKVFLKKKEEELDIIIENEKYDNSMLVPNRKNQRYQIPYGIIFVIFMILICSIFFLKKQK